ncbi:hypothetical protein L3X38_027434 [Prunus dulcis]|uniref:DUF2828 domain-containing protein n=1 Tax=Prunus dulcis TaxID=3755 RepID=A0AAD4VN31_PRUDU|nr:hypothetical protein L3X38_027434 [Prunus dulcis]
MVDEDEDEDDAKRASNNSCSLNYLKQQLPVPWSHNPLTTLKLMICNLYAGKRYYLEAFETAASWLHHNHPKTLACMQRRLYCPLLWRLVFTVNILYGLLLPPPEEAASCC